jgi:DNA repair protein RadA/Sms
MAKAKETAFFCSSCGCETSKWQGQCPACHEWNTLVEAPKKEKSLHGDRFLNTGQEMHPVLLREVSTAQEERILCHNQELDRVLGGGIVPGSLILVGGDPGIGKSTLLLQTCGRLAADGQKVLYISGEESLKQIKLRADRLGTFQGDLSLLCETSLSRIEDVIRREQPDIVVIDSIQTMYREDIASAPGSIAQVRESTNVLLQISKGLGVSIFLVGHVTKEGVVAGPRVLEHMVDTVLYFEGERSASYRILRAVKNRFGSTDEIGVFEMRSNGLSEVVNPSELMLTGRPKGVSGSVVTCCMEGTRPVLLEIQALVCKTSFGMPRRSSTGVDYNRMNLLLAILEKRLGFPLYEYDAYVNVTGGMRVGEPAMDMGFVAALISSFRDLVVDEHTIVFGEVGLAGEIRGVSASAQRVHEAAKLGFARCILPKVSLDALEVPQGIRCIGVNNVYELMQALTEA